MNKKINSFYYLKKILILHEKRHCKHSFKKKSNNVGDICSLHNRG